MGKLPTSSTPSALTALGAACRLQLPLLLLCTVCHGSDQLHLLCSNLPTPTDTCIYQLYRYAFNYSAYAASSRDTIPETELIEWKLARTGYGQSKFVPERLLARACREFSIPVIVVRIGQIAGPVEHGVAGAWPRQEWLPSLVHSCEKLGAVPRDLGPHEAVDWVLVDMTARIIMELVVKTEEKGKKRARFYHVANEATAWKELLPVIKRFMPEGIREVGMGGWVGLLEEAIKEGESEAQVPAVKLWDNFEYIRDRLVRFPRSLVVTLDTKETKTKSSTLAALKRVEPAWMELFMEQWGFERK